MLLRKGFHQAKVKYGRNQLMKVGVEEGSSLHSFFGYYQHIIELNNLQNFETVDVHVLFSVSL